MIGALLGYVGVISPRHKRAGVCVSAFNRYFIYHYLCRCALILSSKGHKHASCTDGGVKALAKTSLGANVKVGSKVVHKSTKAAVYLFCEALRLTCEYVYVLLCAVGVEKFSGDVNDYLVVPSHYEARLFCNLGYDRSLEVLALCKFAEACDVLSLNHHCHSLLRLGDSKLGAVKSLVFLGNCIKIYLDSVSKLADSN